MALLEFNDDLAGFFNSVPREMIVYRTLELVPSPLIFARALLQHKEHCHTGQGEVDPEAFNRTLEVQHLVSNVQLSFRTGVFVANHKCFQQIRGRCIGNHISRVLTCARLTIASSFHASIRRQSAGIL